MVPLLLPFQLSPEYLKAPSSFLIYVNDICNVPLSLLSKILLYADDIFLLHPMNSPDDLLTIQHNLDSLNLWLSSRHLSLDPTKSKYMFFSLKPQATFKSLCILDSPLEHVTSFTYLGLTLTCKLSWSTYIQKLAVKHVDSSASSTDTFANTLPPTPS